MLRFSCLQFENCVNAYFFFGGGGLMQVLISCYDFSITVNWVVHPSQHNVNSTLNPACG